MINKLGVIKIRYLKRWNKTRILIITTILSTIIFYLEINSYFSIGEIINKYFPCKQNPDASFPCFGIYDIYFMVLLIIIAIVSLIMIGIRVYKTK